ncbi:TetR/AcrR family transcriptional regulator [Mumia sp. DW29H23]|uniref:TetR/AcrR family transcriptional regulator n=1 Tax=Mumia sp. DW29H23 TaxID=3421241 RepID=UPI003D6839BF
MTTQEASRRARPMRADARRNYEKILETAREVFRESGADCSLDAIAKRAGVGPGTLYRHFPTREDLVDALLEDWIDALAADGEAAVSSTAPARETLSTWLASFVDNIVVYRGAAAMMATAMGDPSSPIYGRCQVLRDVNARVLGTFVESGAVRPDVDADQVQRLVNGVASVVDQAGLSTDDARPMLDIVLDGILVDPRG